MLKCVKENLPFKDSSITEETSSAKCEFGVSDLKYTNIKPKL